MVYGGKPSTGCQNCRTRRIKCDEARPHCRACVRTGRVCPGYKHPLDVMLRDRTAFRRKKSGTSSQTPKDNVDSKAKDLSPSSEASCASTPVASTSEIIPATSPGQLTMPISIPSLMQSVAQPLNRGLPLPMEDNITSFFFNSYFQMPRDSQFDNGFMELLPRAYSSTKHGSHLHLSTLAVSFFSVAAWTGQRSLLRLSEQFFLKVLPQIRQALQEDIDSNLDEILLTVLLLSTYEELSAMKEWKMPEKAHLRGAVAVINSRTPARLQSPLLETLVYCVQAQIIRNSQVLSYPTVQTPNALPLSPPLPLSVPTQLSMAAAGLVDLRLAWEKLIASPEQPIEEIMDIFSKAQSLDNNLVSWQHTVPPHWIPIPASTIPQSVRQTGLFHNRCDCYSDMWVASTWNSYRDSRIVAQSILLGCLRLLGNDDTSPEIQSIISTIRGLATDICGAVPYYVGSQTEIWVSSKKVEYPEAVGRPVTLGHQERAPLLGGWFVLSYLSNLCSPGLYLEEDQVRWIKQQIQRILHIYTFSGHFIG